jgi:uncharacterized protein (TIGR02996 family)
VVTDEAFIRAVVDRPGDDTPRLAYADWLDEHDDPRGAYLRAERAAVAAGDAGGLRGRAAGLDPVWVARVSRPPVGVCVEHFEWTKCWAPASGIEVGTFEQSIGSTLPPAFRAFVLNNNGAVWGTSDDYDDGWRLMPLVEIREFQASHPAIFESPDSSPEAVDWVRRLLWIGQGFEIIDQLMLGMSGQVYGMICVIDSQVPLDTNYEWFLSGYKPHSTTFAEFLSSLPRGFS